MKSKNEVLSIFRNILLSLAFISRVWLDIREPMGEIIEKNIETLDETILDNILSICEWLDGLLDIVTKKILSYNTKK